jgi:hypothetical protein
MTLEAVPTGRNFNKRAFVALMIAFTGVCLPVSGLLNHLHQFEPLTTARHAWMAAHNAMGILFAVSVTWHLVLNRRMLGVHLRSAAAKVPRVSREAMLAGAIVALVLALAVGHAFLPGASHDQAASGQRSLSPKG